MKQRDTLIKEIIDCFKRGNKLILCGNGGSAAEADHMAAELVGKFQHDYRPALPALALASSGAIITSLGNDRGYKQIFARQIEAYGKKGDMLLIFTTSDADEGHSENLFHALLTARQKGIYTAGLISKRRTKRLSMLIDYPVECVGKTTREIQENQIKVVHDVCEKVEEAFC